MVQSLVSFLRQPVGELCVDPAPLAWRWTPAGPWNKALRESTFLQAQALVTSVAVKRLFFASLECPGTFDSEMDFSMTHTADGNQIRCYIAS